MVPQYDDDEIIEDYEEISDADNVRRVASASGGPVKRPQGNAARERSVRPSDQIRPATTALPQVGDDSGDDEFGKPKGKISKKSARNIWIICIAICVIGIGAVVADLLGLFGRGGNGTAGANNAGSQTNATGQDGPTRELTPRQVLENEFKNDVYNQVKVMERSKAWNFYWTAVLQFDDANSRARKLKADDNATTEQRRAAWAEAIKYYYKARYAGALFLHRYDEDGISMEYLPFAMNDLAAVPDEELKNPRIRTYQAADVKLSTKATNVNRFQTDVIKYELEAGNVHNSSEWAEKTFGEWRDKWDATRESPPVFAEEDLEFVNGPDYDEDEKMMYEKYLEENRDG